ncbi:hypothetical protein Patl1_16624 [Pistacia atlantica]|uniref:Uncharacterized protein n=1 Tax=Pistacia atlantica TaxID=434234 RepID=A0ACC1B968_9ROSI|nr:hypothetical protein Patl1_16624 [Pistacia atlantica]
MSKTTVRRHILEKNRSPKEKEKPAQSLLSKHLKKIYPIGLQRSSSSLSSLSSLSLSLSQNSNDSSVTDSSSPLEQKISLGTALDFTAWKKRSRRGEKMFSNNNN